MIKLNELKNEDYDSNVILNTIRTEYNIIVKYRNGTNKYFIYSRDCKDDNPLKFIISENNKLFNIKLINFIFKRQKVFFNFKISDIQILKMFTIENTMNCEIDYFYKKLLKTYD